MYLAINTLYGKSKRIKPNYSTLEENCTSASQWYKSTLEENCSVQQESASFWSDGRMCLTASHDRFWKPIKFPRVLVFDARQ